MSVVLDHTQDLNGSEKHRLTSIYAQPPFVKAASHDQLFGDAEQLPSHVYGDGTRRLYPCHTAAATWMSALFLMDKKAHLEPARVEMIQRRLDESARFYGIEGEITQLRQKMAADEGDDLARLPDEEFALVWQPEGNLPKERHYTLRNASEVHTASAWFHQHRDKFAFLDRHQIAHKILERADTYGAMVEDREGLEKAAGHGTCGVERAVRLLNERADMVAISSPKHCAEFRKLAKLVESNPPSPVDVETRVKLAHIVDLFDCDTKLKRLYDAGGLLRPEDLFFEITEKTASAFLADHISTVTGSIYEKAALEKLSIDQIRSWLGNDVAEAVSAGGLMLDHDRLADIVTTLPRNDAAMFDKMAAAVGIRPVALQKAAEAEGPQPEEVEEMAAAYRAEAEIASVL